MASPHQWNDKILWLQLMPLPASLSTQKFHKASALLDNDSKFYFFIIPILVTSYLGIETV